MVSASEIGVEDLPDFLESVLATKVPTKSTTSYPPTNEKNQVVRTSSVPPPPAEHASAKPSNISPQPRRHRLSFKHRNLSSFYSQLGKKIDQNEKLRLNEIKSDIENELLVSLRLQLTKTALENESLKAKANNIAVFRPRKKLPKSSYSKYYKSKPFYVEELKSQHKVKLQSELQEALKVQLKKVQASIANKKMNEKEVKEYLKSELADSLKDQLTSVFAEISRRDEEVSDDSLQKMNNEEIKQKLELQLRSLFQL